jgi:hypothetical protein
MQSADKDERMLRSTPVVLLAVTASAVAGLLVAVELGRVWGLICVLVLSTGLAVGAKRLTARSRG